MLRPSEMWQYYSPFSRAMEIFNYDFWRPLNEYPGGLLGSGRVRLYRMRGGRRYNADRVKYNFGAIEAILNNLVNANFHPWANIASSKFKGSNGTGIVTQDEITNQPRLDLTNVTRNRIVRIDQASQYPLPNGDSGSAAKGGWRSENGTEYINTHKDNGQIIFAVNSVVKVWVTIDGWATADPGSKSEPDKGFAIWYDIDRSLWYFYWDNDIVAVVDGNVQVSNFVNTPPGDVDTNASVQAYILFDETNNRIEFWCQTEADDAIKGVGYIDVTGTNDGEA